MINFSVSRPVSMSKPMRTCETKNKALKINMPTTYTHTCNPTFHLHESRKKVLFLFFFLTICIVRRGG